MCACGGQLRRSHLEYLGNGRTLPVFACGACGLAYRGRSGERPAPMGSRRPRPMPDGGHPANPVIEPGLADRLLARMEDG